MRFAIELVYAVQTENDAIHIQEHILNYINGGLESMSTELELFSDDGITRTHSDTIVDPINQSYAERNSPKNSPPF